MKSVCRPLRGIHTACSAVVLGVLTVAACRGATEPAAGGGPRSVERRANRLARETSPYLLQHAHNPVDWYPWGPEAFAKAKRDGKPIFLSIGYSSCHWCHVMERESFEDEGVAKLLNEFFVPIKVDREERPDLDDVYMTAVQLLNGSGGWPLSVFVRPDGKPFFGGTYFPRQPFAELLQKVHDTWNDPEKRRQLDGAAEDLSRAMGETAARAPTPGSISPGVFAPAVRGLLEGLDAQNGGFGGAPKFPPSNRLALLLAEQRRKPDPKVARAITLTLDRMARGGLHDQVGGGFHRYSTDARWLVPHFEKMLYDNALLAWVYLEAHKVLGNPYYRRIGTETLNFLLRELRDPGGAFWSSLDADSIGPRGDREEGSFYLWRPQEVEAALGKADAALFCQIYDITAQGNFEKRSIPNLIAASVETRAAQEKLTPAALWKRIDTLRIRLRATRGKRSRPSLDDKVLADWNGLAIRAFAVGYEVTGDSRYRTAAEEAATFLLTRMRGDDGPRKGRLSHSYRKGSRLPHAFLDDYAFTAVGLLELQRVTDQESWGRDARDLVRVLQADFWGEAQSAFFSTPHGHETLPTRPVHAREGALPSGQSMATLALVRLARTTGEPELRGLALRLLNGYANEMRRYPAAHAGMLLAAEAHFDPATERTSPVAGPAPVEAEITSVAPGVRPGVPFPVTVRLRIRPGWHINAAHPHGEDLIPTRVDALPPFSVVSARYPRPKEVNFEFASRPLLVLEGDGDVQLVLRGGTGSGRATALRLRVRYQGCNNRVCLLPTSRVLSHPLGRAAGTGR